MADECLMAIPEIEGIDYTTREYLKFVNHIQAVVDRLKSEDNKNTITWSPHKVELAIWTHYVVSKLKPDLLSRKSLFFLHKNHLFILNHSVTDVSIENGNSVAPVSGVHQNGDLLDATTSDESNQGPLNGKTGVLDEDTTTSFTEDSLDKPSTPIITNEETNDSIVSDSTNDSNVGGKRSLDEDDSNSEEQPSSKKSKEDIGDK